MVINRLNKMTIKPSKSPTQTSVEMKTKGANTTNKGLKLHTPLTGVGSSHSILSGVLTPTAVSKSHENLPTNDDRPQGGHGDGVNSAETKRRDRMKMLFYVVPFAVYLAISILFILITVAIWVYVLMSKLQYFIRSKHEASLTDIEIGSTWMVSKFLVGAILQVFTLIFAICLLKGCGLLRKFTGKYGDKVFLWLGIISVIALILMMDASLDYFISSPLVQNGNFLHTILPPTPFRDLQACVNKSEKFRANEYGDEGAKYVQINLKWFIEVLCLEINENKKSVPNWKRYIRIVWTKDTADRSCQDLRENLEKDAEDDCRKASVVYHLVFIWIFLDIVGIPYSWALFHLHRKLKVVKASDKEPARFHFPTEDDEDDKYGNPGEKRQLANSNRHLQGTAEEGGGVSNTPTTILITAPPSSTLRKSFQK